MKQKIVITGCLGYIGTELCKLYSGESRYKQVIGIDNRFLSGAVSQLRSWGIEFIHADIRDGAKMKEILQDADIVYHLAGITDVAYTRKHESKEKEDLINSVGIDGLHNILEAIPDSCKLLFPSSHTAYDGLQKTIFDLTEVNSPHPSLMYSMMKVESESLIGNKLSNYIIVRLGSVYGYSGDTMRINIMPNLFSKIASQDGTISLFSRGVQWKSMVYVIDVARAMKFLTESDHTGTYHLSNENMTIRQVAEICKEVNPKVTLVDTDDEIPNLGYTLSNQKLLSTGFKFLYNIKDAIREMITMWSVKEQPQELEYIQKGGNEYIDPRGIIRNYELTEPINLIGYIESKPGTVRANHYHPIQEQKCLLISGRYISVIKDLSYPDAPLEYRIIRPGDIAVIRPNVAHTMVFLQDSVFLNLVRGEREHHNYGITHTIPYELVTTDMRDEIMTTYTHKCRICGCTDLRATVNLGMSPLANNLLDTADQLCDMYPLELDYCPQCYNVQLSVVVPPEKLFSNYLYVSSTSATFRKHFEDAADQYIKKFNLTSDSLVVDIGSNDGVFLKPLQDRGVKVVGVEPATNIAQLANEKGIPTLNRFFNQECADEIYRVYGSPDVITASNMFAHTDDIHYIIDAAFSILKPGGVFIIEIQYLMDTVKDLTFDNIYHEHVNYWSVHALNYFCNLHSLTLFHVEHIDTHGGSIRCFIHRREIAVRVSVQDFLDKELSQGIDSVNTFRLFGDRINAVRDTVRTNMKLLKEKFMLIVGYGSPAKATTALNYFGINHFDIAATIEDNSLKVGKYLPGVNIPITSSMRPLEELSHMQSNGLTVVLAWNFFDSISAKLTALNIPCISIKDLEIPDMPILDTKATDLIGTKVTGKVYDCFMFFNELDTLELRLNILDPVVDYFVICEAAVTHSGIRREPLFEQHKERFSKFLHKIKYILVDSIPDNFDDLPIIEGNDTHNKIASWFNSGDYVEKSNLGQCREWYQRDCIIQELIHCNDDDIIMISELDEITNPDTLKVVLDSFDSDRVYCMRQNSYYYYLNLLKERHWVGARIACYKKFSTFRTSEFKHQRDIIVANGGWHFSYQGSLDQIRQKLISFCHYEDGGKVVDKVQDQIANLNDPFGRGGKLKRVDIDSSYPQYLLDNREQYKHMIV